MTWIPWVAAALAGVAGYWTGWSLRGKQETRRLKERLDFAVRARRDALSARGRTTDRRPEHDDEQPSRVTRMRVIGKYVEPPDRPAAR